MHSCKQVKIVHLSMNIGAMQLQSHHAFAVPFVFVVLLLKSNLSKRF